MNKTQRRQKIWENPDFDNREQLASLAKALGMSVYRLKRKLSKSRSEKKPRKPSPRGREELVERQKKARW